MKTINYILEFSISIAALFLFCSNKTLQINNNNNSINITSADSSDIKEKIHYKENYMEEVYLWDKGHPFKQFLSGEPYWEGNMLHNIQNPQIIIYKPQTTTEPSPSILICPGGSYCGVSTLNEGHLVAKWFMEQGFVAAVLHYSFPDGHPEIPLSDAQQAIRYLKDNHSRLNINPNCIGVVGFSAGGHLASFLSTSFNHDEINVALPQKRLESRPNFTILFYPVITMTKEFAHIQTKRNLIGENPEDKLCKACSTELLITEDTPPTLILHAEDDDCVDIKNSIIYKEELERHSVPSKLVKLPTGGHGFGFEPSYTYLEQIKKEIIEWLYSMSIKK